MRRTCLAVALLIVAAAPSQAGARACTVAAGERALARGAWPQAAAAFSCAAMETADPAVAERATRAAFDHGQLRPAVGAARRWVELDPDSEEARRHLATALLRSYRDDEATGHYALVLEQAWEDRAQGYLALAATLAREGNSTGAARVMERLAGSDPDLPEAQLARGGLWQGAEHGERALAAARRALELKPGWRMAELAEVRALMLLGRTEEGLGRARELAADGDVAARLNLGWWLAGAGRDDEARVVFEALRNEQVAVPQALEGLGSLAWSAGDREVATRHFTELAQVSRGDETALAYLGMLAEERGERQIAIRLLERVTAGPRAVSSQLRAHRLSIELGAPERAELGLEDFLDRSPESAPDLVLGLANRLVGEERADDALALLVRTERLYPDDDDLKLGRAYLLERLDQVPEAVQVMREVLARRPDDPTALNALGYTLADRTEQAAEGYELVRRAIAGRPDSYAIMDSVGWALFRLGRADEATSWLERAWQRSEDPEVAAHLGEVMWAGGRRDEARALWAEALADHPDNKSLKRVMARHPG